MERKIIVTLLAIIMILASASILFSCDNTTNENLADTFSGVLSSESYTTASEAAQAYLEQEFVGETENLLFESYEKKQDLTRKEIAELPLGEYKADDVEKAEKGEVKYVESTKARATDEGETEVQVKIVVLVFIDGRYHHCTMVTLPGEKITKSYYTSVLDLSQHDSYVCEAKGSFRIASVHSGEFELSYTRTEKMIYTKNAIYYETKTNGMSDELGMQDIDMVMYVLLKDDNTCWSIAKNNKDTNADWIKQEIPGNLNDYSANILMAMDQSYFIKTEDGFKLDEKKYGQYLEKIYGALYEVLTMNVDVKANSTSAVYHVKDGLLSSAEGAFNLSLTKGGDTASVITSNSITVSEINSTTLTVPQDVLDLIK